MVTAIPEHMTHLPPPALDECPFCGTDYDFGDLPLVDLVVREAADAPRQPRPLRDRGRAASRLAFDPWKGRLWAVCRSCRRWTAFPLEMRWEALERCERAVRDRGSVRLESEHLSLVRLDEGELVRVGRPPPVEYAGWRYGERMPPPETPAGFWASLFSTFLSLPDPPPEGYDPYGLAPLRRDSITRAWFASPFLEFSSRLTYAFAQVPLARDCPACRDPVLLLPWDFQRLRWERQDLEPRLAARCATCGTEALLQATAVRPALRLGLALVTPEERARPVAEQAAEGVAALGGGPRFLDALARERRELGDLDLAERVALAMVLDEEAEIEALEEEWRRAEEITAIMDGELTHVPGFEAFRSRVLGQAG